jgi:manganese-dependent ADP-ribose/CDP-alcohol diphosphatase
MNLLTKSSSVDEDSEQPSAIFGVLSDIQYADVENNSYHGLNRKRYYRNSLTLLSNAITEWQNSAQKVNQKLHFVLQLGDIIDSNSNDTDSEKAALTVLEKYISSFKSSHGIVPLLHIWGNHEMYCFKRSHLVNTLLNTSKHLEQNLNSNANYYSYEVTHDVVLICLDFYCFSVIGYSSDDPVCKQALMYLKKFNPNTRLNSSSGLSAEHAKFVSYNGALGERQTQWFDKTLNEYSLANKKVIVCGHVPVHREASIDKAVAWDSDKVLDTMHKYKNTVVAYLAGHYHPGGYHLDRFGIHHVTFKAILETKPGSNSFATIYVYPGRISFVGVGEIPTFEIKF